MTRLLAVLFIIPAFSGCIIPMAATDVIARGVVGPAADKRRGPPPEFIWNRVRVWRRLDGNPATYIPIGHSPTLARSESTGSWVVDQRDGKRFFIPKKGANGYSRDILLVEAGKITTSSDWRRDYTVFGRKAYALYGLPPVGP